ncbi:unnamed protein product, partial [Medioppia subpectinata]
MDWLDNQTLERALDKLARMRIVVGYPDDILNSTAVDSIYSGLSLNASDFFGNILTITQWKQNLSFQSLNKLNDINDWAKVGSLTMANAFYNTVKNMVVIPAAILEELGDKPLVNLLTIFGGWPVVDGDQWVAINWTELYLRFRENGAVSSMFFSLAISPDFKNNSQRILSIDHPSFGLGSRDILLKGPEATEVKAYKKLMSRAMIKLGANETIVSSIVEELLSFETLLANRSMAKEERRNLTAIYNKVTIKELSQLAPNIDWLRIIRKYVSEDITDNEVIVLFDTPYIEFLNTKIVEMDNRFLVNYMLWRVVQTELSTLSDSWFQLKEEFEFAIYGTKSRQPRWEMCLKNTKTAMSIALSHLYVKNFFSDDNKEK